MTNYSSAAHIKHLHWQRFSWFSFMITGLLAIQLLQQPLINVLSAATVISNEALLSSTNSSREKYQLPSLKFDSDLARAAQEKADDMLSKDYWSHNTPEGTEPWQFIKASGYSYQNAGENLAYGFTENHAVVNAWMDSEGHRANVLGKYEEVGFGFAKGQYQGRENTIVVAMYATPNHVLAQNTGEAIAPTRVNTNQYASINTWQSWLQGTTDSTFILSALVIGFALVGFSVTHRRLLQHSWDLGKRFAAVHPVLDVTVIAVVIGVIGSFATGFIA